MDFWSWHNDWRDTALLFLVWYVLMDFWWKSMAEKKIDKLEKDRR